MRSRDSDATAANHCRHLLETRAGSNEASQTPTSPRASSHVVPRSWDPPGVLGGVDSRRWRFSHLLGPYTTDWPAASCSRIRWATAFHFGYWSQMPGSLASFGVNTATRWTMSASTPQYDVVIVGAGVSGNLIAKELGLAGKKV